MDTNRCVGYQYQGTKPGNCILIHCSDHDVQTFQQEKDDVLFKKGKCFISSTDNNGDHTMLWWLIVHRHKLPGTTYLVTVWEWAGNDIESSECGNEVLMKCLLLFSVSLIYSLGWREPICWTGPKVTLYESFDASSGLGLMEGAQQMDSVPLVHGKVN